MKKFGLLLFFVIGLISCDSDEGNKMYVKGQIKGFKKGTFYLQKDQDSTRVSVDSVEVMGKETFILTDLIDSPEIYYLKLGKSTKSIPFFAEKDTIQISSSLDKFEIRAVIKGSENQDLLNEYREIERKFNNQDLDMIKERFEAIQSNSQDSIDAVESRQLNALKKKYLFATNFAIRHADKEVAPYLALTAIPGATFQILDTINNSLTPEVKASKYGRELQKRIDGFGKK